MNSEGLYQRGLQQIQKKKEDIEINNEEKIRKELEEVFDFPEINYRSRVLVGERDPLYFHEYSVKWLEDKNKKIEDSRRHTIETERSFSPVRRTGTPPGYQSIVTDWENRVASYFEKKNKHTDIYSHTPEINSVSKAMLPVWNEKVEERLTRLHIEKQEKLEEKRKKALEEGIPTFAPNTNNFNKARPDDISSHLYQEGLSMLEKKKKAADLCLTNNFSFKPAINENSRNLVANKKPRPKTPELAQENPPSRVLKPDEFECFLERNYKIAKNKIDVKTQEIQEVSTKKIIKPKTGESLYEKEMKKIMEKEQKRLEYLRAKEMSELDGCTFKPKVIARTRTPPPVPKSEKTYTKNIKYCKKPSSNQDVYRYHDKNGKIYHLKAFYHIDNSLMLKLEELEKRTIEANK